MDDQQVNDVWRVAEINGIAMALSCAMRVQGSICQWEIFSEHIDIEQPQRARTVG